MGLLDTKVKQKNFPRWAAPYFKSFLPVGEQLLADYQPQGPLRQEATDYTSRTLAGAYLPDPNAYTASPYLGTMADEITRRVNEATASNLARASSAAQGMGGLLSNKAAQSMQGIARSASQDLSGQLAQLYADDYQRAMQRNLARYLTERGYQDQAQQRAIGLNDYGLSRALDVSNVFKNLAATTTQNPGAMGYMQAGGSLLQAIAPLFSML